MYVCHRGCAYNLFDMYRTETGSAIQKGQQQQTKGEMEISKHN